MYLCVFVYKHHVKMKRVVIKVLTLCEATSFVCVSGGVRRRRRRLELKLILELSIAGLYSPALA